MLPEHQNKVIKMEMRGEMSLSDVVEIDKYGLKIAQSEFSIPNCNANVTITTNMAQLTSPQSIIMTDSEKCHVFGEILIERILNDEGGIIFNISCTDSGGCKYKVITR